MTRATTVLALYLSRPQRVMGKRADMARARRGYAAVALAGGHSAPNIGGAMRAAGIFGVGLVVLSARAKPAVRHPCNTMLAHRHIPTVLVEDVMDMMPYDCVPVAIERLPGAKPLPNYTHPERAFYVFGPEDGSIKRSVLERCRDVVWIPSGSLNLAAAVNVVLYDRVAKRGWE